MIIVLILFVPAFLMGITFVLCHVALASGDKSSKKRLACTTIAPACMTNFEYSSYSKYITARKSDIKAETPVPVKDEPVTEEEVVPTIKSTAQFVDDHSSFILSLLEGREGCFIIPHAKLEGYDKQGIASWLMSQDRVSIVTEDEQGLLINIEDPF